jgi:hypothetical protein
MELDDSQGETIIKKNKISFDGRHLTVRIPREIENFLEIKKGDFLEFKIEIPENMMDSPEEDIDKSKLYTISILRGEDSGKR